MLALMNDKILLAELGKKIKCSRLNLNWTRREMSERSGIPYSTLRRIEGTGEGSMRDYVKAMRALGVLDDLGALIATTGHGAPHLQSPVGHSRKRATGNRATREPKPSTSHDEPSAAARHEATQIKIADYPQLQDLCWNRRADDTCSEAEALSLYERNWRFVDQDALTPNEKAFIDHLIGTQGNGAFLV